MIIATKQLESLAAMDFMVRIRCYPTQTNIVLTKKSFKAYISEKEDDYSPFQYEVEIVDRSECSLKAQVNVSDLSIAISHAAQLIDRLIEMEECNDGTH